MTYMYMELYVIHSSEIIKANLITMNYKGIFNGYDAGTLTKEKGTEIQFDTDNMVAQTRCVQDKRCRHLKTEVGALSSQDDGIVKRDVQYVSFIVTLSCVPATGTRVCTCTFTFKHWTKSFQPGIDN